MKFSSVSLICFLAFISSSLASLPARTRRLRFSLPSFDEGVSDANGTFNQLIDHNNPSLGTFPQRYWYNTQFYNGTGSPVILMNNGEAAVEANGTQGWFQVGSLLASYAEAVGGAMILIEHRYWGYSSPYTELTSANLTYHTLEQSIADMNYFARNVKLEGNVTNAPQAPWVLLGGSYPGALAAWTAISQPGTFWAYHGSSAPLQAISDFWQYDTPILQGMPKNCSSDISLVMNYVDNILLNGTSEDQDNLKASFGLGGLIHNEDFASALEPPFGTWQGSITVFDEFCDAIEGATGSDPTIPSANGVGLDAALGNYARYINSTFYPCEGDCLDAGIAPWGAAPYNETNLVANWDGQRQWTWMLCNEAFGWWQSGTPNNETRLVSRLVTESYLDKVCGLYFPDADFTNTEDTFNAKYGGWNPPSTTRLMLSNGQYDPWQSASVSSQFRPGGPLNSTTDLPVFMVPGGSHCADLNTYSSSPPGILETVKNEVKQMNTWVEEFYQDGNGTTGAAPLSSAPPSPTGTGAPSATPTKNAAMKVEMAGGSLFVAMVGAVVLI